ncbi:MAG: HAD family hydrolase [bacterium]|nr:HAD family hydrolase [bacterium]
MKYKYFLFDWDGCLADTLHIWFQAMKESLSQCGIEAPDDTIKQGFQSWKIFYQLGVTNMELFTQKVYEYVDGSLDSVELNDGAANTLLKMREKNLKTAIVSSSEQSKIRPVLKRLRITDLFDCVIARDDVKMLKPDSEPILKAISNIGGEKKETVMIGDSTVDIEAGKKAEISTIWFSSKSNQDYHLHVKESQINPDITIKHFSELENYTGHRQDKNAANNR